MGNINRLNKINSFVDVSYGIHLFKIESDPLAIQAESLNVTQLMIINSNIVSYKYYLEIIILPSLLCFIRLRLNHFIYNRTTKILKKLCLFMCKHVCVYTRETFNLLAIFRNFE